MHSPDHHHEDIKKTSKKVRSVIKAILALNLLVVVIKLIIGFHTKSLSILGDAAHSGVDSLNNLVGLLMIYIASQPPDKDHPYGHEKFETLGALAIVGFLAIASYELIEKSIIRFFNPAELPVLDQISIIMLALTLVINIFVWLYERNMGLKLNSEFLIADAEHTFSDVLITSSILASTFFILKGYYILDPILGILVALIILRSGWEILQRTVPILVDQRWVDPDKIEEIVLSVDKASSCRNIRSRKGHLKGFVDLAVKFNTDSLVEAHRLSHEVENRIIDKYGSCEVNIHIEPTEE